MNEHLLLSLLAAAAAGYLLGGLNGALLISKLVYHKDIRTMGSGNAGLTNFYRNFGALQTLPVLLIDVCKAVLACLIGRFLLGSCWGTLDGTLLGGTAAVIGHMFPVFYGFRGGKGILAGAAVTACADWRCFLILILVFVIIVALTRYVSLGSIAGAAILPFTMLIFHFGDWAAFALAAVIGILAIALHHGNIGRLVRGEEHKLKLHK